MAHLDTSIMAGLSAFEGLTRPELEQLAARAWVSRVPKGRTVFHQDEDVSRFHVLLNGFMKVTRQDASGRQFVVRFIRSGGAMGIAPAIGRSTYPATATAADDCIILSWPVTGWDELCARFPRFATNIRRTVGVRLQSTQDRSSRFNDHTVAQRMALYLCELYDPRAVGRERLPLSRQDLADLTGTTFYSVSRTISDWARHGLVEAARGSLVILDPAGLRGQCGQCDNERDDL